MEEPLVDVRKWFGSIFALMAILLLFVPVAVKAQVPQPLNTPQDQAIRQQMVSTNNVWLTYLFRCAADPTGAFGIETRGTAAAYAYLYTGNSTYAANAWS